MICNLALRRYKIEIMNIKSLPNSKKWIFYEYDQRLITCIEPIKLQRICLEIFNEVQRSYVVISMTKSEVFRMKDLMKIKP